MQTAADRVDALITWLHKARDIVELITIQSMTRVIEWRSFCGGNMSLKDNLSNTLKSLLRKTACLYTWIPEVKRASSGNYEHWAPKDLIAHSAEWTKRQVQQLTDSDEEPSGTGESEDINHIIFDRYKDASWDDVIEMLKDNLRSIIHEVERRSEDALATADPHGDDKNPLWFHITYYGIAHSLIHIAQALVRAGNAEAAVQLQREMTPKLLSIDSNRAWKAEVLLYFARVLSLAGNVEEAINQYNQAITDNPRLAQYAAKEPDLEAIRDRI